MINPEIGIQYIIGLLRQIDIDLGVGFFTINQVDDFVAFGHAANNVTIANLIKIGVGLARNRSFSFGKGRLPNLNRVVFLRAAVTLEINHVTIGKD